MKKYCVVISEIKRIEVYIDAVSEEAAIERAKINLAGHVLSLDCVEPEQIVHLKY